MKLRSLALSLLALSSCTWGDQSPHVAHAEARLKGAPGTSVEGVVQFKEVEGGVEVTATVTGLNPGVHGFHIHEKGDCSALDFTSAGGHFNPTNEAHGGPDAEKRHVGDLGNLIADENGKALYLRVDNRLQLNGLYTIVGKGVIVHEKADDLVSQPTGNAGGRIACGVIEATK